MYLRGFGTHITSHKMTKEEYWSKYPLKYPEPTGEYGRDYVLCPICDDNRMFQSIARHLLDIHHMSKEDFLLKYPNYKIFTSTYSESQSARCTKGLIKSWSNPEYREHKSQVQSEINRSGKAGFQKGVTTSDKQKEVVSNLLKEKWKDKSYREQKSNQAKVQHSDGTLNKAIINGFRKRWVKYTTWKGNEITLKSSYEKALVEFLDKFKYEYSYEKEFEYRDSVRNKVRHYYADFYLPDYNLVLEVKASWAINNQNNIDKMKSVIDSGIRFKFFTEQDLGSLDSKSKFDELIQSNIK